jgi:hypothetical protein
MMQLSVPIAPLSRSAVGLISLDWTFDMTNCCGLDRHVGATLRANGWT